LPQGTDQVPQAAFQAEAARRQRRQYSADLCQFTAAQGFGPGGLRALERQLDGGQGRIRNLFSNQLLWLFSASPDHDSPNHRNSPPPITLWICQDGAMTASGIFQVVGNGRMDLS
jgi:hypothetical protein